MKVATKTVWKVSREKLLMRAIEMTAMTDMLVGDRKKRRKKIENNISISKKEEENRKAEAIKQSIK